MNSTAEIRDADALLRSRALIDLHELAAITGRSIGSVRQRAYRRTLGVSVVQPGGPRGRRFVSADSVRDMAAAPCPDDPTGPVAA